MEQFASIDSTTLFSSYSIHGKNIDPRFVIDFVNKIKDNKRINENTLLYQDRGRKIVKEFIISLRLHYNSSLVNGSLVAHEILRDNNLSVNYPIRKIPYNIEVMEDDNTFIYG